MPEKTDNFRANVRRVLANRGMTQNDLAKAAGLSREWLSKMLAGKSNPTLPVCERIATALQEPLEGLVARASEPTPDISQNPVPGLLTGSSL